MKEIPKWLFSASFFVLVALLALSVFKGEPFLIDGKGWGWQQGDLPSDWIAPIGSIVAWDKEISDARLPFGWVECDGQPIHDPESPYDGDRVPDLNGTKLFLRGGTNARVVETASCKAHRHDFTVDTNTDNGQQHSHAYSFNLRTHSDGKHSHDNGSVSSGHVEFQTGYTPFGQASTHPARSPVVLDWPVVNLNTGYTSSSGEHDHSIAHSGESAEAGSHAHEVRFSSSTSAAGGSETRPANMSVVWIVRVK